MYLIIVHKYKPHDTEDNVRCKMDWHDSLKSTRHTFWKSINLDLLVSRRKRLRLLHTGLRQMLGWVYLNCCSTSFITPWQSKHRKVPLTSSGWTGWVRTTWPLMRTSEPTFTAVNSRILQEKYNTTLVKDGDCWKLLNIITKKSLHPYLKHSIIDSIMTLKKHESTILHILYSIKQFMALNFLSLINHL